MNRRILALLAALALLPASAAGAAEERARLTLKDLQVMNGGTAGVYTDEGDVTFLDGACSAEPVLNQDDARRAVLSMIPLLGGNERTRFEPWRILNDPAGNVYYVFQQVLGDTLVPGGAVKVITDADGKMLGLTGSVVSDLPEDAEADAPGLTAEQAEALVLRHERDLGNGEPALAEGRTEKIVLPVEREMDTESEVTGSRYVWSVYTTNPSAGADGTDLPYLAHYVTLSGEYLYSLPTIVPGDRAGAAGYDASYTFEFMEPAEYTGYVDFSDGTEREITVTLMRDTRTGMYYLGNLEHRIVVADCWEFLYNNGRVVMEYSPDNREWDQTGLLALYNYGRAWNYFKEIGWLGGDGDGTPIIVLKDFCDPNHNPVDNAAYAGKFCGWQTFLSSSINDLSQCLDVCAHEFTHCVTGSAMTYNAYLNDYGAINEAISDIHGNLCEMMAGATEDTSWLVGEGGRSAMRSMSEPNLYQQPGYVWDVYYRAGAKEPTAANDYGGVHTNSSLLNHVAWLLCAEGGMTLEEARAFWFAADCAMVPGSDYPQLKALLPFVLRISGLDAYRDALADAIARTRLGETALPESVEGDKALLKLTLPETEAFDNGKWVLNVRSLDVGKLSEKIGALIEDVKGGNLEGYPALIRDLAAPARPEPEAGEKPGFLEAVLQAVLETASEDGGPAEPEPPEGSEEMREFAQWLGGQVREVLYSDMGSAGQDGHSVLLMSRPGRTIPVLMYVSLMPGDAEIELMKFVCLLNGRWYDVSGMLSTLMQARDGDGGADLMGILTESELFGAFMEALQGSESLTDILNALTLDVKGAQVYEIPAAGLERVDLTAGIAPKSTPPEKAAGRKSRPKEP